MADEAGVWVCKRMFLGLFLQLMNKALQCGEIKVYYPDRYRFVLCLETENGLMNIAHVFTMITILFKVFFFFFYHNGGYNNNVLL